jgi:LacI family transcriptional regulator
MKKRVGLKDIARQANCSISMVSIVLNDRNGKPDSSTAKRIRIAAKQLGYQSGEPENGRRQSFTLGLVIADITNGFFSRLAGLVENEAKKLGYTVLLGNSDEKPGRSATIIDSLLGLPVDGLIIAAAAGSEPELADLQRRGIPFVLVDRYFRGVKANSIIIDNYKAALSATHYLLSQDRRRHIYVTYGGQLEQQHLLDRQRGWHEALRSWQLPGEKLVLPYTRTEEILSGQLAAYWAGRLQPDALFFANQSLAIAGLKSLRRLGVISGEELSVATFGEDDAFWLYPGPIHILRQPLGVMASEALRLLLLSIDEPGRPPDQVVLRTELIHR